MTEAQEKQGEDIPARTQLAEAEAIYLQNCAREPDNAAHWINLGKTQHGLGRLTDAEASARHALQLQENLPDAYLLLGAALQLQGRLEDALSSYHAAARLDPTRAESHYYLANLLRETGDTAAAITAYQRLLQIEPEHFAGLNNLGALLLNLGDSKAAAPYLRRALQQQQDNISTLINLGDACVASGYYDEALKHLQYAVGMTPDSGRAWRSLANAQHHAGMMQEALASYERLARLQPDSADATLGQARILEQLGKHQETYTLLQPLLESGHDDATHTFFNISKQLGRREEAVAALEGILNRENLPAASAADTHYKLGRHYDEIADYDRAFLHYQQANELTPAHFNLERMTRFVSDNIAVYSREFIKRMPMAENRSELPVFILGMPRSGTSLVEQILASHPEISGGGELPLVPEIVQRLAAEFPGYVYPMYVPRLTQRSLDMTAARHLQALQAIGGASTRVTDKLPHNFRNIGLITQLFPAARIIHCTRNPLDTCLSCYFARFGTTAHGYTHDLIALGQYYIQYRRLMEHWESVFPGRILTLSYKDMVLDQGKTTRQLVGFCGLEWDDRCLEFHENDRFVFTLSYDQVRQPIYTGSLDRWKHYQEYLQPLRELLESSGVACD